MVDQQVQDCYTDLRNALLSPEYGLIPRIETDRWKKIQVRDILRSFELVDSKLINLFTVVKRAWKKGEDTASQSAQVEVRVKSIRELFKEPINQLKAYDSRNPTAYIQNVALVQGGKPEDSFQAVAHWAKIHLSYVYTTLLKAGLIKEDQKF